MIEDHLSTIAVERFAAQLSDATFEIRQLPADRWLARSALQKAVRRGDAGIAIAAAQKLLNEPGARVWRDLAIIAMEDCGSGNIAGLRVAVSLALNREHRRSLPGGEARAVALLAADLSKGRHCQAACDLLLNVLHEPALKLERAAAVEQGPEQLALRLREYGAPTEAGVAALALGGRLSLGQKIREPDAVFHAYADGEHALYCDLARRAWKATGNEMALLLPPVLGSRDGEVFTDDSIPCGVERNGIPTYAVDQFTRLGRLAAGQFLVCDPELAAMLTGAGFGRAASVKCVGDLVFLLEGTAAAKRRCVDEFERLRTPYRFLSTVPQMAPIIAEAMQRLQKGWETYQAIRASLIHSRSFARQ